MVSCCGNVEFKTERKEYLEMNNIFITISIDAIVQELLFLSLSSFHLANYVFEQGTSSSTQATASPKPTEYEPSEGTTFPELHDPAIGWFVPTIATVATPTAAKRIQ
jgi:hypothetical protein